MLHQFRTENWCLQTSVRMIAAAICFCILLRPMQSASTTKAAKLQKCSKGDCSLHDSRLRNFLSSALTDDFSSVLATSAVSAFVSTNVELGDVFYKCGRLFYTSHNQVRFGDAVLTCAKKKMQLVAVEEGANNMNCLVPDLDQMSIEEQKNQKYFFIWTSGMAEGSNCGNAAYSWCAGNRTRINAKDLDLPAEVGRKERCLVLSRMTKSLVRMNCAEKNYFFCEVYAMIMKMQFCTFESYSHQYKCKSVSCMRSEACVIDNTFFDSTKKLKRRLLNGVWADWIKQPGDNQFSYTTFIFGHKKVTWTENMKMCCRIGMKPVRVTDDLIVALNTAFNESNFINILDDNGNLSEDRELVKTSFWTAATRQGCAGQFRFCMHDDVGPWDSQDQFWDMVNPRDDGSCLVVDRQYAKAGSPFGVRQVQCSSQSANFACQKEDHRADDLVNKDQESYEERVRKNCDLPYCTDLEYCGVNKNFSAKSENGDYLLIKPTLLGKWKTSCGVRYLMSDKIMDWRSAMSFCCSLGMNLISVQSQEKLNCLDNILESNVVYWTSGTNGGCSNQRYRWCSSEFKDFIKPSVNLRNSTLNFDKNGERADPSKKYCVILKKSEAEGPILGIDLCNNTIASKSVICEARVMAESHLQEIFNECKMTHRLTQRDIEKFSSTELDTFSYKMKCLMTCMAELLGLLYDSGKLWVDSIEKAMRRVKQSQVLEDFRSLMKKYPTKLFKKAADNLDALKMMLLEQNKEQAWKSTLFVNEALDRFWECTRIVQFNTSQDECFFIHNFIKCFTNETASLGKFWNMNLHNIFDSKEYVYTMRKSLKEIEEMVENANIFTNPDPISKAPRDNLAFFNKISYTEEFVSSKCVNHYLRPKNLTDLGACTVLSANFMPITEDGHIRANIFIDKKFYPPLVAAAMCERANGSLVTAEELNTGEIFSYLDKVKEIIGNPSQKSIGFGAVLLDEYFVDSQGELRWCSTSAVLPQELQNVTDNNQYNLFFSSIDQYFFTFVDDAAADSQLFFCKFDSSFLSLCGLDY